MQPLGKGVIRLLTFGLAAISLAAFWITFELRYVWHVQPDQLIILRSGIGLAAAAIVVLWCLYPSRVLVALLGLAGLFFPPLLDQHYVGLTAGFVPLVLLIVALLLGTTQLRRMQRKA